MLLVKPQLDAANVKLAVLAVGVPSGGKTFCDRLPFPEENLFLDPSRKVYRILNLNCGAEYLWNKDARQAISQRKLDDFKPIFQRELKDIFTNRDPGKGYTFVKPQEVESTLQQGGLLVVDGPHLLYLWRDPGMAAHAPTAEVLAACGIA